MSDFDDIVQGVEDSLTPEERDAREALETAAFYVLLDAWLIGHPDDPTVREYLIEEDGWDEDYADLVLAKVREIGADRGIL